MDRLSIHKMSSDKFLDDYELFIDGKSLPQVLSEYKNMTLPENVEPFDDLCLAWTKGLDCWGDVRFVWHQIEQKKAIVPILM